MRLTVKHFAHFGADRALVGADLRNPEAWDRLRTATDGPFGLPASRAEWERSAEGEPEIRERAQAVNALLPPGESVASYGVGKAAFELWLHRADPSRRLAIGEYADATVDRLGAVFPEADVVRHDLTRDAPVDADWQLFHRIDTEFSDATWREVFGRFASQRIVLVAAGVSPTGDLVRTRLRTFDPRFRRAATRAGWTRNRASLCALWADTHDATHVAAHDLPAWRLVPRR